MEPQETPTVPKGLKAVLIEGTDGRFDRDFQLYRTSFEHVVEETWSYLIYVNRYKQRFANNVQVYEGGPADWLDKISDERGAEQFVVSETRNPEWCFSAPLVRDTRIPKGKRMLLEDSFGVSPGPAEALIVEYDPWEAFIRFDLSDPRAPVSLASAGIRKIDSLYQDQSSMSVDLGLPFEIPLIGRGWGKLNHQHIYDVCETRGIDLQEPNFLTGRFVIFDMGAS